HRVLIRDLWREGPPCRTVLNAMPAAVSRRWLFSDRTSCGSRVGSGGRRSGCPSCLPPVPWGCCGGYFRFAGLGWWPAAVLAVAALSFVTYGSTSHDLVHRSLGLP